VTAIKQANGGAGLDADFQAHGRLLEGVHTQHIEWGHQDEGAVVGRQAGWPAELTVNHRCTMRSLPVT